MTLSENVTIGLRVLLFALAGGCALAAFIAPGALLLWVLQ
jgi:hypothetical protein